MTQLTSELKTQIESTSSDISSTIAVTGSSGLVGTALCEDIETNGDKVIRLSRKQPVSTETIIYWDPAEGVISPTRLNGIDAIVHLAGENIADSRWTKKKKYRIRNSRVIATRRLSEQLSELERPPRVLICASATDFYGDRGDELLNEQSSMGNGFLADVCQEWEEATSPAIECGVRVVNLRIGVVISSKGGALAKMLTPFRLGLGGKVGSGKQYWSWIHLDDVVGAIQYCITNAQLQGPVNCVSPSPVTNLEFTKTLGRVMSRPAILPLPGLGARIVLGEMANDLLLVSTCVVPKKLLETGYKFHQPQLPEALKTEITGN